MEGIVDVQRQDDECNNVSSQKNCSILSSQEKLSLSSWGLPESVLQYYKNKGISQMFPWQLDCLMAGKVLDGGNLVYSAPTSAGKTLVVEILISQTVLERQKKVLVILPFVSVSREKMYYFQGMFSPSGIRVEGYMGGHSPGFGFRQAHIGVCTIEKANSIINRLLEEDSLHKLGLVVVDELHLLGDPYRGYLLELLLTKLKYMCSVSEDINVQIVGMSATLPNLKLLANWLNADLFYTEFRPVPLSEKLKCGKSIFDKKCKKLYDITPIQTDIEDDTEQVGQLCLETIENGHSVLVFCPTKVWCETLAGKISTFFKKLGCSKAAEIENTPGWILRKQLNLTKINEVLEHLRMSPVGLDTDLGKAVAYGVAFHHAGLTFDERDIIEGSFRQGSIRVLCATSTLSSGVNLPARRVIIRSAMSFGGLMDVLTYKQMIGRAGRMGVDTEGESILICKPTEKVLCHQLMSSNLKPIESCLGHGRLSASLKRAVLEVVASGVASTPEKVKHYADCTFLASSSKYDIQDPIQSCIQFLEENEFIRLQQDGTIYKATPLGQACLASSLPPDEGLSLFRELQRARRCFVLDTDLHIIYQVTPYSVSEQWSKLDWLNVLNILEELPTSMKRVGEMVGVEESFLARVIKGSINVDLPENSRKLSIHRRFYTSLALQDLVNEISLTEVAQKYDCSKGMLQSLQQSAATYAGMVTEFTRRLGWGSIELIVSQFQERLQFGIQRELCDLMRLPILNGIRARALYSAGFTNLSSIAKAEILDLENALHSAAPFQSKKVIPGETSFERDQRKKLESVWVTGKAGMTIHEAAAMLVTESRSILAAELGVDSVIWSGGSQNESRISVHSQLQSMESSKSHIPVKIGQINRLKQENLVNGKLEGEISTYQDKASVVNVTVIRNDCSSEVDYHTPTKDITYINTNAAVDISQTSSRKDDETDYYAASISLDGIPDDSPKKSKVEETSCSSDSDTSDSSIEVVYHKTVVDDSNSGKFSDDMFDMDQQRISTPADKPLRLIAKPASETMSPDLFSESLTFDTQLQRVLDFDELPKPEDRLTSNKTKEEVKSSTSFNSDDMGFFSDTSPPKAAKTRNVVELPAKPVEKPVITESFFANAFESQFEEEKCNPNQSQALKRKSCGSCSPDFILDSDESVAEGQIQKRARVNLLKVKKVNSTLARIVTLDESDDEIIMGTPKLDRTSLSKFSVINRQRNKTLRRIAHKNSKQATTLGNRQRVENGQKRESSKATKSLNQTVAKNTILKSAQSGQKPKQSKKSNECGVLVPAPDNWEEINIVDVCGNKEVFQSFCEELKGQNIVGLALGCRQNSDTGKKNIIGSKIRKNKLDGEKKILNYYQHEGTVLDGIAFYWSRSDVFYVSMDDSEISLSEKINFLNVPWLREKVYRTFDAKEQVKMLQRSTKIQLYAHYQDPKIASWLLSQSGREQNLSSMVLDYLPEATGLTSLFGLLTGVSSPGLLSRSPVSPKIRACVESILSFHVISRQLILLRSWGIFEVFENTEMPMSLCLADMELTGFQFDRSKLLTLKEKLECSLLVLEKKAHSLIGRTFALNSPAAVIKALYTDLQLGGKSPKLTKTKKKPSINKEALQELEAETEHPLPGIILQWRKIQSVLSKVVGPLLQIPILIDRVYGVSEIHTSTGRISMHEPNLQNIPRDFEVPDKNGSASIVSLRSVFVAGENRVFLAADYCQIELRLLAHLSQDEGLIRSVTGVSDLFIDIAATMHDIPYSMVSDELRQKAKQTCYGMIYGIGARTLSHQLHIEENDALALMEEFKKKYLGVKRYIQATVEDARKNGYVKTLFGRRRYLPAINHNNAAALSEAERQAVNTTVQGSAADLAKTAMVLIQRRIMELNDGALGAHLVLHLHDELIYEVEKKHMKVFATVLKDAMENALELSVPTPVKIRSGPSWGELEVLTF